MNKPNQLKISLVVAFVTAITSAAVMAGLYFLSSPKQGQEVASDAHLSQLDQESRDPSFGWKYPSVKFPITGPGEIAYSDIRDPGGIPQGLPVRLKIPIIGVDSAIEDALITPDGRMDVPQGSVNVAWFALGPHPGREGSAVIGGHFGIRNGIKFVFYDLDKLKIGDKVYVTDDKGDTLAFQVRRIQLFERDADATTVFTSNDGKAHLNLITCEGIWNRINDTYPQRRVVFTDAIPAEVPAVVAPTTVPQITATFPRTLSLGMKGPDVTALQTFLEKKGFLTMPRGITKGYFGKLTRIAVMEYQRSVGLPSDGIFNLATRAKLISDQSSIAIKPTVPIATHGPALPSTAKTSPFSSQIVESIKSLYETPMDGLITSILIIVIAFTAFKIIRNKFKKSD